MQGDEHAAWLFPARVRQRCSAPVSANRNIHVISYSFLNKSDTFLLDISQSFILQQSSSVDSIMNLFNQAALPHRERIHLQVLFGLFLVFAAALAAADYPKSRVLLEADKSIAGETLRYPDKAPAKVSAVIVDIAPGSTTGWHRHGTMMFAYMLSGELEIEYQNGRRMTVKAGDAFMEAMTVPHIGANLGNETASVLAVFMEGADTIKTIILPAPDTPPPSPTATRAPDLVDLSAFDPRLKLDIRYATDTNFMSVKMYPAARAWLQRPAAEALRRAHDRLQAQGYGLVVFDAYRPWQVTRMMWDRFPKARAYLADPLRGSRHNRAAAVDVSLFDLSTGNAVAMPSEYDEFSERARPDFTGGSANAIAARDLLIRAMKAEGFNVYENEWWHFDYQDWESYPVLNQSLLNPL